MNSAAAPLDRDQFASAADYAYVVLRQEIVEGRFPPGRRMREIELAQRLGISRTPIRQALSRLEIEGLLDLKPRMGLVVSVLDDDAVDDLYEMRAAVEGTAAAMAARHASPRDLALLDRLLEQETTLANEPLTLYRHNRELHEAIYAAAHNRYLVKSLQALHDAIALLGPTTLAESGRATVAHAEHAALIEAIRARDDVTADRLARAHILGALDVRRGILARERDRGGEGEQGG